MGSLQHQQELLSRLDEILALIQENPDRIPDHIFDTVEHICTLYNQWKHARPPSRMYSPEQQSVLQGGFQRLNQQGGAKEPPSDFDKEYSQFETKLQDIGTQLQEILQSVGIVSFDSSFLKQIKTAQAAKQNPLASRSVRFKIYQVLSAIVEALRIWILMQPIQNEQYQFFSSLLQTFLDIVRGEVKQAAVSAMGMFTQNAFRASIIARFLLNIVEIVSPDLPLLLGTDFYSTTKSTVTSLFLWYLATFSPEQIKQILNDAFSSVKRLAESEDLSLSKDAKAILKGIEFRPPYTMTPSFDDLVNLRTVLQNPDFVCDPSVEKMLAPIRRIQSLRLVCDLLNLPLGQVEYDSICASRTRKQKQSVKKGGSRFTRRHR